MEYSSLCVGRFAVKGCVIGNEVELWRHPSAPEPCRVVYGADIHPGKWAYHLVTKRGWTDTDLFMLTQHEVPARILLHAFGLSGRGLLNDIAAIAVMSPSELMGLARKHNPDMDEVTCMITDKYASAVGAIDLASGSLGTVVRGDFTCRRSSPIPKDLNSHAVVELFPQKRKNTA